MPEVKLIHGDCLQVMRGMDDNSVDAVIGDPPYGIDYQSARRSDKSLWKPKIENDKQPFLGWGNDVNRIVKSTVHIFYRWDVQGEFEKELQQSGLNLKSQIIWDKVIHGMGDLKGEYAPQHENIFFATKSGFFFHGKRPSTIIRQKRVLPDKLTHPNEKPVPLIAKLILDCTRPGDTILDPFMGSGTTGVACVQTGRNFIGIEIDEKYYAIAQRRIKDALQQPNLFT